MGKYEFFCSFKGVCVHAHTQTTALITLQKLRQKTQRTTTSTEKDFIFFDTS